MAKKTPQTPPPPPDDFDPELELAEEIAPIDDEIVADDVIAEEVVADDAIVGEPLGDDMIIEEVVADDAVVEEAVVEDEIVEVDGDDVFGNVVADDGDGATQLGHAGEAEALPEIEVEDDAMIVVDDDDAFANVVAEEGEQTTKLGHAGDEVLPDVEVDDEIAEVEADEALVASKDAGFGDDFGMDDDVSAHEAATVGNMAALDDDDPFAGVGGGGGGGSDDEGELVGAGVGSGGGDEEPYYEEEIPKPKTHWFTWTLIGLNIVAALVAPYMLMLDFHKRQQYAYGVLRHDLAILGLPNEEEEKAITAARVTLPSYRITPEEMKRIVGGRGVVVADKFEGYNDRPITRVPPSVLDKDILKEHFAEFYIDSGEPINTVEKEMKRIQASVLRDFEDAAQKGLDSLKNEAAKREKITKLLHPLAMDIFQSEKLAKRIKDAQGADLDKLYMEAAQRRMAFDFLLPLEMFRPGDPGKGLFVEKFGDLEALPLEKVLARVTERIESTYGKNYQSDIHLGEEWSKIERDTIEKRLTMAFTLISLAHVKKPDGELLYPTLMERIPFVMGQYDFALASELFPSRLLRVNELVLDRIRIDREGYVSEKEGTLVRGKAFIDFYEDELQRIRFLQNDIFKAKIRLADLQEQKKRDEELLTQRKEQREDVLKRIAVARAKTAKDIAELRVYQDELFRFQSVLATSEEQLTNVHNEIREKLGNTKAGPKIEPNGDK